MEVLIQKIMMVRWELNLRILEIEFMAEIVYFKIYEGDEIIIMLQKNVNLSECISSIRRQYF